MSSSDDGGQSRKRLVVGVLSACMLVAMVVGTVAFFLTEKAGDDGGLSKRNMSKTMRSVELFCAPADYQGTCHETLERALSRCTDPAEHPHAAAAAAITAVERALAQGFNRSEVLDAVRQSNDTLVWEAIHDCRMLLDSCRDNVERALSSIAWRGVEGPSQDLQAWLSAVITFQGSCVDMFPKGEIRDEVKTTMEKAREISSNALAVIKQGAALASMLDLHAEDLDKGSKGDGTSRRLEESVSVIPTWVPKEERRLLGGKGGRRLTPNVTVAKDGSGDFTTISTALDAMPAKYTGRYFIYVKEGVYDETVNITNCMGNLTMYGDGSKKSIVTGSKSVLDGIRMWRTATFAVDGDSFTAMRLGIRNTAGVEKQQALALRVKGDKAIFFNCRIEGNQDTLFAQAYRQFYRSCVISGTVDFIMGDAAAVFQRCVILVRQPRPGQPAVITAHARRDHQQTTGFVIHRSRIIADDRFASSNSNKSGTAATKTYLGRPWKDFARTVVMESVIEGFVHGQGYMPWEGKGNLGTAFFGEFANSGDGANVTARKDMQGFHVMNKDKALQFTVGHFLHGADWIPESGTPVSLGLSGEEE
ncbi:putative pectinesterase/pectinesterase inhibitor 13 [Dichanthelium oligosanthes]|uniref:pectinesterase n=1 Tax=Dichanthelium oligosanthes TaxID=888268 RepID=A0A1E5WMW7_9POAL|nr:putative pectinesterase/pectinesterase inhibitor 13 [Dichanthelium oligosanthes]